MVGTAFTAQQLQQLTAALPLACMVVDERGVVLTANASAREIIGGEPTGEHITFAFRTPSVLAAFNDALTREISTRAQFASASAVQQNLDIHAAPLGTSPEGHRLALVTLHDITYQERIERMRSDFVANASHELRTPLTSLAGFIETMQGPAKADIKAQARFLDMMKAQAERMARLIDDLLSLSRIEVSEHMAPTEKVDLVLLVRQVSALLASVAEASHCELKLDLPETLSVTGDAQQLSQVIHNLIENAIKYAGDGKPVEVCLKRDNGNVLLSVRDNGPGIAPHHVPRLTERFYRVSAQDSRKRGGTGLGLAIAKHIMNRHRGKLLIDSVVGQGSTFSISIPAQ